MILQEHLPLWKKIQDFAFDDAGAAVTFSGKLATSQNWSVPFTQRAIEEYRKFLLLCCISEKWAAPSHTVDEVWHLHLTYTRSYWMDLCRDTLGKEIHHYPSAGGNEEDRKHQQWYQETLLTYRAVFGTDPPADIWPPPREEGLLIPEEVTFSVKESTVAIIVVLLALPFLFIGIVYHTLNPFALAGPNFLAFFPLYGISLILAHIVYRGRLKKRVGEIAASRFPEEVSAFQMAHFLYGKHRAVQAGIVDLIKRGLLELTSDNHFLVKNSAYRPLANETNPLMTAYAAEPDGSLLNYESLSVNWYDREKFSNPALEELDQWAKRGEPFWQVSLFPFLFYVVAIVRMIQGFYHDRPISYLVLETIFVSILFFIVLRQYSRSSQVAAAVSRLYAERLQNMGSADSRLLPLFALEGIPAINGFAEGVMLAGLFGAYDTASYRSGWGNSNGSSCGSGSSCSGGSSCGGGGGCGGCGGG